MFKFQVVGGIVVVVSLLYTFSLSFLFFNYGTNLSIRQNVFTGYIILVAQQTDMGQSSQGERGADLLLLWWPG